MKRLATALSACVALLAPARARAQAPSALRLAYEASPGCPTAPSFRGQVVARTSRVRFVEGEATEQVLFVSLVQEPGRVVGRLRVDEARGASLVRELSGANCDEVASALALVAALAFDPQAKTEPLPPPPEAPPRPPPRPAPGPAPAPRAAPAAASSGWRFAIGAQGRLDSGALPGLWPQGALFVELGSARRGWPSPSVRLAGLVSWRQGYEVGGGRASFALAGGRLEGCPARFGLLATLDVRPCVGVEAAWLQGQGKNGAAQLQADRAWAAVEASGRLRWAPAGAFFLEAQTGLGVPLTPYRFVFRQPDTEVHKVAPVGVRVALALGLSFS